jgi:hypothetical protein
MPQAYNTAAQSFRQLGQGIADAPRAVREIGSALPEAFRTAGNQIAEKTHAGEAWNAIVGGGENADMKIRAGYKKLQEEAAQRAATDAAVNPTPKVPGVMDQFASTVGKGRDWLVQPKHYLPALGIGLGLGGLGLWYKNKRDREQEEEEQALLEGMHPKAAMVKLAAEFPIQIGFLARCGERGLTGTEVRMAVEKCAALSDDIADEWTRFFVGAAGLEAGATSGLTKAAQDPIKKVKVNPLQSTGGGAEDAAAAAQRAGQQATPQTAAQGIPPVPGVTGTAAPKAPVPPQAPAPGVAPPASVAAATPGARAVAPAAAPEPAAAAAPAPPVDPYAGMTQIQKDMARAPSNRDIVMRRMWQKQVDEASRALSTPGLSPEEQVDARANYQRVLAAEPAGGEAAGVAGANRPVPGQLEMRNLRDARQQEVLDAATEALGKEMGTTQWMPTVSGVKTDQELMAKRINEGMNPALAQRLNFSSAQNDPTLQSYALGTTKNVLTKTYPALYGQVLGAASDLYNMDPSLTNSRSAWRDFASIPFAAYGPQDARAARPGGLSFSGQVMPRWSKNLEDYATAPGTSTPMQYIAGGASDLAKQYDLIANIAGYSRLGGAGGGAAAGEAGAAAPAAAGLLGRIPMLSRAIQAAKAIPELSVPGGFATWGAMMEGLTPGKGNMTARQVERMQEDQRLGKGPTPAGLDMEQWGTYAGQIAQGRVNAANEQSLINTGVPLTPEQIAQTEKTVRSEVINQYTAQRKNFVDKTVPGMQAKGKIDLSGPDYNPTDTRKWMSSPGRAEGVGHVNRQANETLEIMAKKLPPETSMRITQQEPLTPEDMVAMQKAGVDPAQATDAAHNASQSFLLLKAQQEPYYGNMQAMKEQNTGPQGMAKAVQNPQTGLADEAKQKTEAGEYPDPISAVKGMWDGLGTAGQLMVGLGLPVALFGLMNSFMGEGGMGSMLMTLLGGAGVIGGLHQGNMLPGGVQDLINNILSGFGLSHLAAGGTQAGALKPPPGTAATGAGAGAAGAAAAGVPAAPATTPAVPAPTGAPAAPAPAPTAPATTPAATPTAPTAPTAPAAPAAPAPAPAAAEPAAPVAPAQATATVPDEITMDSFKDPATVANLRALPMADKTQRVKSMLAEDAAKGGIWSGRIPLTTKFNAVRSKWQQDPAAATKMVQDAVGNPTLTPADVYDLLQVVEAAQAQ